MGLDMYAYVGRSGQRDEFWEGAEFDEKRREFDNKKVEKPRELAYWRKHPNLHGWMEKLWLSKGGSNQGSSSMYGSNFNGVELELTWEDIEKLERDLTTNTVSSLGTTGFFFGDPSDDHYREQDLAFIRSAKAELFLGLKVFYNSSW